MKRVLSIFLTYVLVALCIPVSASAEETSADCPVPYAYYTDTITYLTLPSASIDADVAICGASQFVTGTKTRDYKNASHQVVWSVSITATFTYNMSTVRCITCTPSAVSNYPSVWEIKSVSSHMSTASATGTAVAEYKLPSASKTYTESVTLNCSESGNLS